MRILLGIPCLYGGKMCDEAIASVVNKEYVSVLLIDNGAETDVKQVIEKYAQLPNVYVIRNSYNKIVNPAWNQIMEFFLDNINYSHLVIMNSDIVMQKDWDKVLINRLAENSDEITVPKVIDDKYFSSIEVNTLVSEAQKVDSGTAGIFITLNRKQVGIVYPIPEEIKCWYGDNWIYESLRALGYETVIPNNLLCYHAHSQTVQLVKGISEIIEEDKRQWANKVEPMMLELIKKHKQKDV